MTQVNRYFDTSKSVLVTDRTNDILMQSGGFDLGSQYKNSFNLSSKINRKLGKSSFRYQTNDTVNGTYHVFSIHQKGANQMERS